ncbi:MAG: AAA family ATPase [Planctomycetota bacterium]
MAHVTNPDRLHALLTAGHPAISIVTHEEREAIRAVEEVAKQEGSFIWLWTLLEGVRDGRSPGGEPIADTEQPAGGLYWLAQQRLPSICVLADIAVHLEDPHVLRSLRRLIDTAAGVGGCVVLIDHSDALPDVIKAHATSFELSLPSDDEIEHAIRSTLKALHRDRPIKIDLSGDQYRSLIKNLRGLGPRHIAQIIRDVVALDRRFDADDLNRVLANKRKLVSSTGTLEYVESPASLDDIGGLTHLKAWLAAREKSFDEKAQKFGLVPRRGVLMLGVQGAGKSLCAKAIATAWRRPLLKLDPGTLYDRYVGESERRLRDALKQAEAMAPIVLWIDEIEKGFAAAAAQSTDGGLSQRMFGTLLTWMNDHTAPVFVVATANNIEALPPELLRKGRFDEIFFVDLPAPGPRAAIFKIHLRKRKRDPGAFDLDALAAAAEGFSGAEIEQAVVAAMHRAFSTGQDLTQAMLVEQIETSPPLSVTMAEKIARLRAWAADRCVPAG